MGERKENRLAPCRAAGLGHDRRNHVDELGKACGLHPIGVVEKRDTGASEGQRILHGIDLFKDRRRHRPAFPDPVGALAAGGRPPHPSLSTRHPATRSSPSSPTPPPPPLSLFPPPL